VYGSFQYLAFIEVIHQQKGTVPDNFAAFHNVKLDFFHANRARTDLYNSMFFGK